MMGHLYVIYSPRLVGWCVYRDIGLRSVLVTGPWDTERLAELSLGVQA
jgi:hypothetical protein